MLRCHYAVEYALSNKVLRYVYETEYLALQLVVLSCGTQQISGANSLALCMEELFNQDYTIIVYLVTGLTNVVTNANMRFEGC